MHEHHEPEVPGRGDPVEEELAEPLLIHPLHVRGPGGERVRAREPGVGHDAAADERKPAVLTELVGQAHDQPAHEQPEDGHGQALALEPGEHPSAR